MKLADLKNRDTYREKISAWLDKIGETDQECRGEVFAQCEVDKEARAYYFRRSLE